MNGFPTLCLCVHLLVSTILIVRQWTKSELLATYSLHPFIGVILPKKISKNWSYLS